MHRLTLIICIFAIFLASCGAPSASTPGTDTLPTLVRPTPQPSVENCVDARLPTPDANGPSLFAPVSEKDHLLGPTEAYVTVLVYSDFQCATCAKLATLLKSIQAKYPKKV